MQRTIRFFAALAFLLLCSACSDEPDCGISLDQVSLVTDQTADGTTYHLVKRISGFQEKVVFYELYDQTPEFDACRQPLTPAVAGNSVTDHNEDGEPQQPVAAVYNTSTNILTFEYQTVEASDSEASDDTAEGKRNMPLQLTIQP